ncbi:hypothetical protein OPT61_g3933 [Boeremia exigua]|uniref:Uncharacterized protein n=1 Tax=Boeremia exigua TaxID=749465 RepID=A0ACC2IG02_9PLEO|nr:hypothetical protein OPT61_g3933 [Boeremia exigua]
MWGDLGDARVGDLPAWGLIGSACSRTMMRLLPQIGERETEPRNRKTDDISVEPVSNEVRMYHVFLLHIDRASATASMVLGLISLAATVPMVATSVLSLQSQAENTKSHGTDAEWKSDKCHMHCRPSARTPEDRKELFATSQVVLRDGKLYVKLSNYQGERLHPFTGYFLPYPNSNFDGLVSTISDEPPQLNWIYLDTSSKTFQISHGLRIEAEQGLTGPWGARTGAMEFVFRSLRRRAEGKAGRRPKDRGSGALSRGAGQLSRYQQCLTELRLLRAQSPSSVAQTRHSIETTTGRVVHKRNHQPQQIEGAQGSLATQTPACATVYHSPFDQNPCHCKVIGPTIGFVITVGMAIICWPASLLCCCCATDAGKKVLALPVDTGNAVNSDEKTGTPSDYHPIYTSFLAQHHESSEADCATRSGGNWLQPLMSRHNMAREHVAAWQLNQSHEHNRHIDFSDIEMISWEEGLSTIDDFFPSAPTSADAGPNALAQDANKVDSAFKLSEQSSATAIAARDGFVEEPTSAVLDVVGPGNLEGMEQEPSFNLATSELLHESEQHAAVTSTSSSLNDRGQHISDDVIQERSLSPIASEGYFTRASTAAITTEAAPDVLELQTSTPTPLQLQTSPVDTYQDLHSSPDIATPVEATDQSSVLSVESVATSTFVPGAEDTIDNVKHVQAPCKSEAATSVHYPPTPTLTLADWDLPTADYRSSNTGTVSNAESSPFPISDHIYATPPTDAELDDIASPTEAFAESVTDITATADNAGRLGAAVQPASAVDKDTTENVIADSAEVSGGSHQAEKVAYDAERYKDRFGVGVREHSDKLTESPPVIQDVRATPPETTKDIDAETAAVLPELDNRSESHHSIDAENAPASSISALDQRMLFVDPAEGDSEDLYGVGEEEPSKQFPFTISDDQPIPPATEDEVMDNNGVQTFTIPTTLSYDNMTEEPHHNESVEVGSAGGVSVPDKDIPLDGSTSSDDAFGSMPTHAPQHNDGVIAAVQDRSPAEQITSTGDTYDTQPDHCLPPNREEHQSLRYSLQPRDTMAEDSDSESCSDSDSQSDTSSTAALAVPMSDSEQALQSSLCSAMASCSFSSSSPSIPDPARKRSVACTDAELGKWEPPTKRQRVDLSDEAAEVGKAAVEEVVQDHKSEPGRGTSASALYETEPDSSVEFAEVKATMVEDAMHDRSEDASTDAASNEVEIGSGVESGEPRAAALDETMQDYTGERENAPTLVFRHEIDVDSDEPQAVKVSIDEAMFDDTRKEDAPMSTRSNQIGADELGANSSAEPEAVKATNETLQDRTREEDNTTISAASNEVEAGSGAEPVVKTTKIDETMQDYATQHGKEAPASSPHDRVKAELENQAEAKLDNVSAPAEHEDSSEASLSPEGDDIAVFSLDAPGKASTTIVQDQTQAEDDFESASAQLRRLPGCHHRQQCDA